jgi:hypothetical protein
MNLSPGWARPSAIMACCLAVQKPTQTSDLITVPVACVTPFLRTDSHTHPTTLVKVRDSGWNARFCPRRPFHPGCDGHVLYGPRSCRAHPRLFWVGFLRVAGHSRRGNGRRHLVDALRGHAGIQHAWNGGALRARANHSFSGAPNPRNWSRLFCSEPEGA